MDNETWKSDGEGKKKKAQTMTNEEFERKIAQIKARRERHEERVKQKKDQEERAAKALREAGMASRDNRPIGVGDTVRMKGSKSLGEVVSIEGNNATVLFGGMRSRLPLARLERCGNSGTSTTADGETPVSKMDALRESLQAAKVSRMTQDTMENHRKNFRQDLDVRGMRGDEALSAVRYFIDDAILMGMTRVRILHGKGNGILRNLIRQYLSAEPNVTHFQDEHVQFGGAGITVVDF